MRGDELTNYWLVKSEPDVYPFSQLQSDGSTHWDGVRNYQARNFMRDKMKLDDLVLFYHSNTKPPHIAGLARVCKEGYPDHTSWDPKSKYFDEKSSPENPRWSMIDIEPIRVMTVVSLSELKQNPALEGMPLLARGQRLSVQPVSKPHFDEICKMGGI
ncbi:MAG TPA: EVE domain-containing protein [Candidatus Poseidoniales archaeon]|jgi:predicted RNA-binding protein with PUA-like domain|nr:MAG: EVE domain-containing protein [Euryarchaeota archaeon]HIF46267.1 EVE domain-containing protein [Candidatus Poseidoniales archaeon]HIL64840.1 EVE domain-containing protein [Candidatus Poseidoniales archaeon]